MKKSWVSFPYIIWMLMFILIPLILVAYYSLTVQVKGDTIFSLDNFQKFFQPVYLRVLLRSLGLALISTVCCLVLGYPVAMILADKELSKRNFFILLFVLPMWMNLLLRTYAWMALLERKGLINSFLSSIDLPTVNLLYTNFAVVLGMVYNFLPFMVLPIYSVLRKIDYHLVEAAEDLGADSFTVFRRVIFPLSLPGVISGITMVFMPAVSTFVISRLLGGGQFALIGNLIEQQFLFVGDWHFGSALSIVMMVLILISMVLMPKSSRDSVGGGLW